MVTLEHLRTQINERDAMERRLEDLNDVLRLSGTNMNDPLVDQEGFPRNDVDVALIRQTRHDIICLRNDLKAHMNQLEKDMQEYYKDGGTSVKLDGIKISDSDGLIVNEGEIETCNRTSNEIFIKIDDVIPNSPSAESGLLTGDLVIQFGSVCADTFKNLSQIQEMVIRCENKIVRVTVLRNNRPVRLNLVPKIWSGHGLLGCKVIPTPK